MADHESDPQTDDRHSEAQTDDRPTDRERVADRWLTSPALDATLPTDLRAALAAFLGAESVRTLREWTDAVRRHTGGGALSVPDLCHADGETVHRGTVDGERHHFECFYDAVILAALTDSSVDVRTESPGGAVVEARVDEELTVTPETATVSFGVDPDRASDGDPTLSDGYAAVCPYVRAFPDRTAYERWAAETDAPTVAMPLSGATALAAALAE